MSEEQLLRRSEIPPTGSVGESEASPSTPVGVVESRASWEELLDLVMAVRDVIRRLKRELRDLCSLVDYDFVAWRDRREQGKGIELRVCRHEWEGLRCRYYYISKKRMEQLEKLGLVKMDSPDALLSKLKEICRTLGLTLRGGGLLPAEEPGEGVA